MLSFGSTAVQRLGAYIKWDVLLVRSPAPYYSKFRIIRSKSVLTWHATSSRYLHLSRMSYFFIVLERYTVELCTKRGTKFTNFSRWSEAKSRNAKKAHPAGPSRPAEAHFARFARLAYLSRTAQLNSRVGFSHGNLPTHSPTVFMIFLVQKNEVYQYLK